MANSDAAPIAAAQELITALLARGVDVYVISGGFRELCMPVAKYLGISPSNVIANRMYFTYGDDDDGERRLAVRGHGTPEFKRAR